MAELEITRDGEFTQLRRNESEAEILLNRPDRLNAANPGLAKEMLSTISELSADSSVRAVSITGAGRAFSSGADLMDSEGLSADGLPDFETQLKTNFHPIVTAIRNAPQPYIAAVNGPAAGISASFALACDLVVAAKSAYFLLAFVNIGLIPDGGASALIPARIGFTRASELSLLGNRLSAEEALDWGMINRVWDDEEFVQKSSELRAQLANGPTLAFTRMKRALDQEVFQGVAKQLDSEAELQQELAGSEDFREGALAFAQKRPAEFQGK